MVDRLAKIALSIAKRLARFPHHDSHQSGAIGLEQIGGPFEHRAARRASEPVEVPACGLRRG